MSFVSKKKTYIILLVFLFIFSVSSYASNIINNINNGPLVGDTRSLEILTMQIKDQDVGATIYYGNYEQDGDECNGKEPVSWIILEKNYTENTALLISKFLIDCLPYDGFHRNVTWETCSLRDYMNHEMLSDMFTIGERSCIKKTFLGNAANPYYGTSGGNPTYDYLFIPGIEDIAKYFSNPYFVGDAFSNELLQRNEKRMAVATKYAMARGLRAFPETHKFPYRANYFLRTPGSHGHRIWYNDVYADYFESYITELGELNPKGTGVNSMDDGIRPMMWVYY